MKEFKILLLGAGAVGKTTFFHNITGELLELSYNPTFGVNIGSKIIELKDNKIKINFWDLGGQTFLRDSWSNYYSETDCAIFFYDITRKETFIEILNWKEELNEIISKPISLILIGNKSDLESERQVTQEEGEKIQNELDAIAFYEISALHDINMKIVLEKIIFTLLYT